MTIVQGVTTHQGGQCVDCGVGIQRYSQRCRQCHCRRNNGDAKVVARISKAKLHVYLRDDVGKEAGRKRAKRLYSLDDEMCERCDHSAEHRHHKDGDTLNNERDNIEFLCATCHHKEHRARGKTTFK